ncbi:MAG: vanadium-dependent haloperoxidase [Acidobacteriaceae bacterium]|nr:vanadium-dependent haloperoxidase [Acidobacteriaceae bacterium]MBV9677497.1 vanadium-dependent haloperoxidase [Acidobacteriaceae bacterium]
MKFFLFNRLIVAGLLAVLQVSAQNVATTWNSIAAKTIAQSGNKDFVAPGVWFAYVSIAVYDAVNAVHHHPFEPFYYTGRGPGGASDEAAAAAAAHRVLVYYFPAQEQDLDARFINSLGSILADATAKAQGVGVGEAAADALISERAGDGLQADVPYTPGNGPGAWQPTPPLFLPPATPWLGQMRPFTMTSASQFLPTGPTALSSEEWVTNYNVTRLFGDANSSIRTPGESEVGLFWTENAAQQYSRAFGYLSQYYKLDLLSSSRLLAFLWTGFADAGIACWNAKYTYGFWRPITAIRAGGSNPELAADTDWTSFSTTPNHPEYPAGHTCLAAVLSSLVQRFFASAKVHVTVDSLAFSDGVHTHTFEDTKDWLNEVYWARIFTGAHFPRSLEDGATIGKQVADQLFRNHFQPKERD